MDTPDPGKWHYMVIHTRHIPNVNGLKLVEQVNGSSSHNVYLSEAVDGANLDYTLTVTNRTNVDLKDMLIRYKRPNNVNMVENSAKVTVNGAERGFTLTQTAETEGYTYYDWKIADNVEVGDEVVLTFKAVLPSVLNFCGENRAIAFAKPVNDADTSGDVSPYPPNSKIAIPTGYGNAFSGDWGYVVVRGPSLRRPTSKDLQQVSVVIRCKDNYKHDSGIDWWKLGHALDGIDGNKLDWRDTWRSIGEVTQDDDGTYQCIVTFYAGPWADMRITGTTLKGVKDETGIEHVYYGTTVENGDDKAAPGGEGLETV